MQLVPRMCNLMPGGMRRAPPKGKEHLSRQRHFLPPALLSPIHPICSFVSYSITLRYQRGSEGVARRSRAQF